MTQKYWTRKQREVICQCGCNKKFLTRTSKKVRFMKGHHSSQKRIMKPRKWKYQTFKKFNDEGK